MPDPSLQNRALHARYATSHTLCSESRWSYLHQIESAWSHSTSRLLTAFVVIIDVSELPWLVSLVLLHPMLPCSLG